MITLRGKQWTVTNVTWTGAEPDVGIMSDYVDSFDLEDENGELWDWDHADELTKAEGQILNEYLATYKRDYDE